MMMVYGMRAVWQSCTIYSESVENATQWYMQNAAPTATRNGKAGDSENRVFKPHRTYQRIFNAVSTLFC